MYGYKGKMLKVDLTNEKITEEPLRMDFAEEYIGGKGLAARYLLEELKPGVNPLSPENILIFMTGPITGTNAPASAKYTVVTKSPATNTFLDCYAGGTFMADLKFAGYDGIIIKGKSEKLVYLEIRNEEIQLKDASQFKGKGVYETTEGIQKMEGKDFKVACIGPAGEKLVKFACITSELHHNLSRGGPGAVMGSKNLKAVAVKGEGEVEIAKPEEYKKFYKEVVKRDIMENPDVDWARTDGTPSIVDMSNEEGLLPTNNFQFGVFEEAKNINADTLKEKYLVKKVNCFKCPIGCRNVAEVREGKFKGLTIEGPEYETIALMGSNLGIGDLGSIIKLNDLCDNLGLDTISSGNVLAFTTELYLRGYLRKEDLDNIEPGFGNVDNYIKLLEKTAYREGAGNLLAEGVRGMVNKLGGRVRRFALEVKGLEYPGYDPRGSIGMALAYATSDRGACHMRAWPVGEEAFGDLNPFTTEGKAKLVIDQQNQNSLKFSMIFCDFYPVTVETMHKFYQLVTGKEVNLSEFERIGEKIWNLVRVFNVREGFRKKNDYLPERMMKDPLPSGPAKGKTVSKEDFEKMLMEYYQLRGWDEEGVPTKEKLKKLGLSKFSKMVK